MEPINLSLDQIVRVVEEIDNQLQTCKTEIQFTKIVEAEEYSKTLAAIA